MLRSASSSVLLTDAGALFRDLVRVFNCIVTCVSTTIVTESALPHWYVLSLINTRLLTSVTNEHESKVSPGPTETSYFGTSSKIFMEPNTTYWL